MSNFVNIAVVQMAAPSTNPNLEARKLENVKKMEEYIDTVFHMNPAVDFIVFPEICAQGLPPADYQSIAETIPGPITDIFCKKAKEYGKWILPGSFIEKREGEKGTYNTAILISPEGKIELKYSKVFIPYPLEGSTPGSDFPVLDIPKIGKVGILICADVLTPEPMRNLVFKGAELIFKPTFHGYWAGGVHNSTPICQTRSLENQCFLINSNQPGPLGMGHSCITDPEGRVLEEVGGEETFFILTINMDEVRRARETGSMGFLPWLKNFKTIAEMGAPLMECYSQGAEGISKAPLYLDIKENHSSKQPIK